MGQTTGYTGAPLLGEPLPVELMNTIWADGDGVADALTGPDGLNQWLCANADRLAGWPASQALRTAATPRATHQFRQLRDALRSLAAAVATDEPPAAVCATTDLETAVAIVNRASAKAPRWSELVWPAGGEPRRALRSHRTPTDAALSDIAEQAVGFFADPHRPALRVCQAPGCGLYFVRAHPRREWCSDACGNRARVARHYQRHRPTR